MSLPALSVCLSFGCTWERAACVFWDWETPPRRKFSLFSNPNVDSYDYIWYCILDCCTIYYVILYYYTWPYTISYIPYYITVLLSVAAINHITVTLLCKFVFNCFCIVSIYTSILILVLYISYHLFLYFLYVSILISPVWISKGLSYLTNEKQPGCA